MSKSIFHVWEKYEIVLTAENKYENPYTEVEVWVELEGPGFCRRVYGFWDGGSTFKVRIAPMTAGNWNWVSGSNQNDKGLNGKIGGITAVDWTEAEKEENICRRGFVKATANGHALEHADGTPYFLIGDTWLAGGSFRYPWNEDDNERPMGPEAGFKDYVKFRKKQGYNSAVLISCFPAWANDGEVYRLTAENGQTIRDSWVNPDTQSGKDMHNEGGRPFLFPGKVPGYEKVFPDMDRINPEYFQYLDKRMDYFNEQGFVPFLETMRRDVTSCWKKHHSWPESYVRFVQYIFSRYQANNCFMSPIHYDWSFASVSTDDFNICSNLVLQKYGAPAFGTLLSANANPSTKVNFEQDGPQEWLQMQLLGNKREHEYYWLMTEMFRSEPSRPVLNGEPYYAGYFNLGELYEYGADGGSEEDAMYCRSGMYGGFLSGSLSGHMYGAEGIWGADIEPGSKHKMWDAFGWSSAAQLINLKTFAMTFGKRYQDLIPEAELIAPNKSGASKGFTGWSYCAHSPERDLFMFYFEQEHPGVFELRRLKTNRTYSMRWFDTIKGEWSDGGKVKTDENGTVIMKMDDFAQDKGMSLVLDEE